MWDDLAAPDAAVAGATVGYVPNPGWRATTHDWSVSVDPEHLVEIRRHPEVFAPGGVLHLVHEVVAYAADEAVSTGIGGRCTVTLHTNGTVSVSDDGRGTDTRRDSDGLLVKKPVMTTKDLRFFDHPGAETLPDGQPRRGMSVVAALSVWLVHLNRRLDGAWQQRYEYGVPVTGLDAVAPDGTTGTTVSFQPASGLKALGPRAAANLASAATATLDLVLVDLR